MCCDRNQSCQDHRDQEAETPSSQPKAGEGGVREKERERQRKHRKAV